MTFPSSTRGGKRSILTLLALALCQFPAYASPSEDAAALTPPTEVCVVPAGDRASRDRPACRTPDQLERLLRTIPLEILNVRPLGGSQNATIVRLNVPRHDIVLDAKWRPWATSTRYNDPAGGLLAHALQKLVLEPHDYVVPVAAPRCFPLSLYRKWVDEEAKPYEGTRCVLGFLSYWLSDAITLREARRTGFFGSRDKVWAEDPQLFDPRRFKRDAAYRRAIANLNVMAYLSGNGDAHAAQFVLYKDPFHVFVVDNSVAFRVPANEEMRKRQNLAEMIVPAVPASTARRVMGLSRTDIEELAHIDDYAARAGVLLPAGPASLIGETSNRIRKVDDRVQIGLSSEEVEALWDRVQRLQRDLSNGALETF